jgi:hypothetical protein
MTAVLEGSSVSVKTMSDGTLRLSIDIEPRNAQAAFALFGAPGRAVALAALKDGHAKASAEPGEHAPEKKPREYLGDLCYRAVQWCNDPEFQKWIAQRAGACTDIPSAEFAASIIKGYCGVKSRKDIDGNPDATEKFRRLVVGPWQKHQQARRSA